MTTEKNNADYWQNWLDTNISDYFSGKRIRYTWRDVKDAHDPNAPLAKTVAQYATSLSPDEQTAFRAGLAECAKNLPIQKENQKSLEFLCDLFNALNDINALTSGFLKKITFDPPLGRLNSCEQDEQEKIAGDNLFISSLGVMRNLSRHDQNGEVAKLGHKMLESPNFPSWSTYLLLLSMTRSKPDSLFEHWKAARPHHVIHLENCREKNVNTAPSKYATLGSELLQILTPEMIGQFEHDLKTLPDYNPRTDTFLPNILSASNE
ncbi:MAG: hypothetical protein KDJ75_07225 [Alphaproteobacteria bacterium]|nr:hypothetical protein [Alphaproteobacteria bacterium]